MFKKVGAFLVCAITLFCAVGSYAQGGRTTISGYVYDTERKRLPQIQVELLNDSNSVVARFRTDTSGRFLFSGVQPGRYSIRVLPLGTDLEEQSVDVEITSMGPQQAMSEQRDIYLKSRKSSSALQSKDAVVYAQDVPKEAEKLFKDGVSDLDGGRAQTGTVSLEKAIEIFPTYFAALERLGAVRLVEGKFEAAAEMYKRALAVYDRTFDSWYGLGYASYSIRKFSEAVSASEKAVALKPGSLEANLLLGMSSRIMKDLPNAEKALKKAVKINDGSADAHWQLALLYGKDSNRYSEAAKELEKFLELSPDAPNKEDIRKLIKQFKEKGKAAN